MKTPIPIYIAIEDDLSEWVVRRLLKERPAEYALKVYKRGGFGWLKKNAPAFNNLAKQAPVLLRTDLDRATRAPTLMAAWLNQPKHPNFLFRVAVQEVEAWLLASSESLSKFLALRAEHPFSNPECLTDPKNELLKLALRSPKRKVREAIVRQDQDGALRQGPAYNPTLSAFVINQWNVQAALGACPSLHRVFAALAALEKRTAGLKQ